MFNGQILRQLIANAGLTKKEFEKQMFGSKSTDLYHLEKAKNLRSDTLERLRDVLKCSMMISLPHHLGLRVGREQLWAQIM